MVVHFYYPWNVIQDPNMFAYVVSTHQELTLMPPALGAEGKKWVLEFVFTDTMGIEQEEFVSWTATL